MKVKVTVKSGNAGSGTVLSRQKIRVVATGGKPRITGKPIYTTSAQMNIHISRGTRPTTTQPRRYN